MKKKTLFLLLIIAGAASLLINLIAHYLEWILDFEFIYDSFRSLLGSGFVFKILYRLYIIEFITKALIPGALFLYWFKNKKILGCLIAGASVIMHGIIIEANINYGSSLFDSYNTIVIINSSLIFLVFIVLFNDLESKKRFKDRGLSLLLIVLPLIQGLDRILYHTYETYQNYRISHLQHLTWIFHALWLILFISHFRMYSIKQKNPKNLEHKMCSSCGHKISNTDQFCPHCGVKV